MIQTQTEYQKSVVVYLSDPKHKQWEDSHYQKSGRNCYLIWEREWAEKYLAPRWSGGSDDLRVLTVVLLDTQDGKRYIIKEPAHYEETTECIPPDYDNEQVQHLQLYMFEDHFCPCHRKSAAQEAGAITDNVCDGERFLVEKIEWEGLSGLIFYSETMTCEQLEESLRSN